jgi:hypothetical protein
MSRNVSSDLSQRLSRWDQAIEDAKDTIQKCERKIQTMKGAIEVFKEQRAAGEPWPGDSPTNF